MSGAGGHNSVDAAMLRSMQKQAKFEEKEAKEQERKRERDTKQAAAAAPAKATKRMMTTKARKQMRTEAQRVEDPQLAQEHIFKVNGKQITLGRALYEIVGFLKARQDLAEAEFDEVRTATGISVETAPKLIQALDDNERVDMPDGVHGRKLRYRPPYGVRNAESLRHVLEQTYPSTGRGCETVKRSDLVGETYDGVARDIDKLCADGVCAQARPKRFPVTRIPAARFPVARILALPSPRTSPPRTSLSPARRVAPHSHPALRHFLPPPSPPLPPCHAPHAARARTWAAPAPMPCLPHSAPAPLLIPPHSVPAPSFCTSSLQVDKTRLIPTPHPAPLRSRSTLLLLLTPGRQD